MLLLHRPPRAAVHLHAVRFCLCGQPAFHEAVLERDGYCCVRYRSGGRRKRSIVAHYRVPLPLQLGDSNIWLTPKSGRGTKELVG
jgi:hypothetical protein